MKLADVEAILRTLNNAEAQYLIVDGLAVVAHGYVRYTADVDIVLHLERENILRAMNALEAIGYRPLVPVKATDFADGAARRSWIQEKNMIVFQMRNRIARARASTSSWQSPSPSRRSTPPRAGKLLRAFAHRCCSCQSCSA